MPRSTLGGNMVGIPLLAVAWLLDGAVAYPGSYGSGCFVQPRGRAMSTSSADDSRGIQLSFNPAIVNGEYVAGRSYQVTVTASGGQRQMLGSTSGSWANNECTNGGQRGVRQQSGTWTAPNFGPVTVGGTSGGPYNYGVDTVAVTLQGPTRGPTSSRPTPNPTQSPTSSDPSRAPTTSEPTTSEPTQQGETFTPSHSPTVIPSHYPTSTSPSSEPTTPFPTSASPSSEPTITTTTFRGVVADTLCIGITNSIDGVNASATPYNHTVSCMLFPACRESGYTAMRSVGEHGYRAVYQLDDEGERLVAAELERLESEDVVNNLEWTLTGVEDPDDPVTYQGQPTYNGVYLGIRLRVQTVQSHIMGPTLPYPLQPSTSTTTSPSTVGLDTSASASSDDHTIEASAISAIVVVVLLAIVIIVVAEKRGTRGPEPADGGRAKGWHENPQYQDGGYLDVKT